MTLFIIVVVVVVVVVVLEPGKPGGRENLEDGRRYEDNIKTDLQ
jgi:preprotein translocase subunit SecG